MEMKMPKLTASNQDYLEAILELSTENAIRSIDIAQKLGVSRASVNRAIGVLKESGLVTQERYSDISLTEKGKIAAVAVNEKHHTLKSFLTDVLSVCEKTAEIDACKMEHCVSPETLEKLKEYLKKQGK
jgi:Mn-dependent DtxR family transcriptional regulator